MKLADFVGQSFGFLTVIERGPDSHSGRVRWWCSCTCNKCVLVIAQFLKIGKKTHCGCQGNRLGLAQTKHGQTRSPTWWSWIALRRRCEDPSNISYQYYGALGVAVSPRWQGPDGFLNFLADMGERPPGMTIDRFHNRDGNYEPGNCRWATPHEQSNNRRNVTKSAERVAEVCGRHMRGESLSAIAAQMKIGKTTVARWLREGETSCQQ